MATALLDAATWREAARQLREEADMPGARFLYLDNTRTVLHSLARRFENEARAAERAKEKA